MALVDDDELFTQTIRLALNRLSPAWTWETYLDPEQAVQRICRHPPQAVLLDFRMPGWDGLECIRRLKRAHPGLPVLMFTASCEPQLILDSVLAGAVGYLSKMATAREVQQAVQTVLDGGGGFNALAQRCLAESFWRLGPAGSEGRVPPREAQVLAALLQGLSNKEIAFALHVACGTVGTYLRRLLRRFHVRDRHALVRHLLARR